MPTQKERLLQVLAGRQRDRNLVICEVADEFSVKTSSVRRRLNELVAEGKVQYKAIDGEMCAMLIGDVVEIDSLDIEPEISVTDTQLEEYLAALEVCQDFEKEVRGLGDGKMTTLEYSKQVSSSRVVEIKESGWFAMVYYSDWHVGAIDTKHRQIYRECKIIEATDGMYVGFQGDLGDAGSISKHQGIKHEQMSSPSAQRKICLKFAEILAPKLLFMILGCHDYWAKDAADYDFVAEASRIAKCKHLGGGGRYWLRTREGVIYNGVAFHKVTGYSQYNDCHPCVRRAIFHEQDADIITVAHTHIVATAKQILGERTRFMARTAARKEFDGYALKLAPDDKRKDMDVPVLLLHGTTKQGEWVHGIEKAAELLTALRGK